MKVEVDVDLNKIDYNKIEAAVMKRIEGDELGSTPEQIKDTADDKLSSLVNILKDIPDEKILEALKNMG